MFLSLNLKKEKLKIKRKKESCFNKRKKIKGAWNAPKRGGGGDAAIRKTSCLFKDLVEDSRSLGKPSALGNFLLFVFWGGGTKRGVKRPEEEEGGRYAPFLKNCFNDKNCSSVIKYLELIVEFNFFHCCRNFLAACCIFLLPTRSSLAASLSEYVPWLGLIFCLYIANLMASLVLPNIFARFSEDLLPAHQMSNANSSLVHFFFLVVFFIFS